MKRNIILWTITLCCLAMTSQTANASMAAVHTYTWDTGYVLNPGEELIIPFDINKDIALGTVNWAELTLTFSSTTTPGLKAVTTIADRSYQTFLTQGTTEGLLGFAVFQSGTKQDVYSSSEALLAGLNDDGKLDVHVFAGQKITIGTWDIGTVGLTVDNATLEVTGTPVPVPGAAWLLGAGLMGLIGIKRKGSKVN